MSKKQPPVDTDRDALVRIKEKSQDDFERQMTYIAAGSLGLSMTFLDKIVNIPTAVCLWLVVISWSLLTITLLVNLISHFVSSRNADLIITSYDSGDDKLNSKVEKGNSIVETINIISIATLMVGIALMVTFVSINLYHPMKNSNEQLEPKTQGGELIKKGRTITTIRPDSLPKPNTNTPNPQTSTDKPKGK